MASDPVPPKDVWSMTPAEAKNAWDAAVAAYQAKHAATVPDKPPNQMAAREADIALKARMTDQAWIDRLTRGLAEAHKEFTALALKQSTGDRLEAILAGDVTPPLFESVAGPSVE